MTHRRCPACGDDGGGRIVTDLRLRTPDGHPLQGGYPVVSCLRCGSGFADVIVPAGYYEDYYGKLAKYPGETEVYRGKGRARVAPSSPVDPDWLVAKADDSAERIDALLSGRGGRVLDVGCSTGGILAALGRRGYEHLYGVDPSPESVRIANARPGLQVVVGTFSTLPADLGTFDCICVTGVLEHLWDVDAAVVALRPLLRPGGFVYVEVPDAGRYLDPYIAPYEDFSTEHVNHFSFPGLRRVARRHGLRTISEIGYLAPLTSTVTTGCAAVAWSPGETGGRDEARDDELEATLFSFAERSAIDFAQIEEAIELDLGASSQYVLWGVGEAAFKLLALPPFASRRASAYVDGNASRRGFRFDGMQVVPPKEIVDGAVPIVACSLIRADSIAAAASELELSNPVVRLDQWRRATSIRS